MKLRLILLLAVLIVVPVLVQACQPGYAGSGYWQTEDCGLRIVPGWTLDRPGEIGSAGPGPFPILSVNADGSSVFSPYYPQPIYIVPAPGGIWTGQTTTFSPFAQATVRGRGGETITGARTKTGNSEAGNFQRNAGTRIHRDRSRVWTNW